MGRCFRRGGGGRALLSGFTNKVKNQRYFRGVVIFGVGVALLLESYGRLVNNLYVHVAFFVVFLPRLCHSVIQLYFSRAVFALLSR